MKTIVFLFGLLICTIVPREVLCTSRGEAPTDAKPSPTFVNPIRDGADPWVMKLGDKYYTCRSGRQKIIVTESRFLTRPERSEIAFDFAQATAENPELAWTAYTIWAPELHYIDGKWYIFYAGGERNINKPPYTWQRAGVLVGDSPFGPFECRRLFTGDDPEQRPENDIWSIDMTHLEIDGKHYAVWSGWPEQVDDNSQNQLLYIAEITQLGKNMKLGKRHLLAKPEESWEVKAGGEWISLVEGASELRHGDDIFIVYSTRGSWAENYRMGLLKLIDRSNPLDIRSWEKHGPVFIDNDPNDEAFGVGHASYTTSPDGRENWIMYHSKKTRTGGWQREVYLKPFTFDSVSGLPLFGKPVGKGALQRPSGEYELEKKLSTADSE